MANALVQSISINFFDGTKGPGTYGTASNGGPGSNTVLGDLLFVEIYGYANDGSVGSGGSIPPNPGITAPVILTPTSSDGSIWTYVASCYSSAENVPTTGYVGTSIALYCQLNAAAMFTSNSITSFLQSFNTPTTTVLSLRSIFYEFSGSLGSITVTATASGSNNIPATANLVTPSTDLIFVGASYANVNGSPPRTGTGYTSGRAHFDNIAFDQYILNQTSGSIATAMRAPSSGNLDGWACIAAAFGAGVTPPLTVGVAQPSVWINS